MTRQTIFHRRAQTLGVLFLRRGQLHEAATAFERARTLMPDDPDPRLNLSLVFEAAQRTDDALDATTAIEADPERIPSVCCASASRAVPALEVVGKEVTQIVAVDPLVLV